MKYSEFANEVDEHFAAVQKLINGLDETSDEVSDVKQILIEGCISLNHHINNDCAPFLESE